MQETASQGQAQQQQQRRKNSTLIAGAGAAVVAAVITVAVLMSSSAPPTAVKDQAANASSQCQIINRKMLVSTTTGSGTVRLREGSYLSPPIVLNTQPQAVVFPLPRPEATPAEEVIIIEGNAKDLVITSDVTPLRRVIDSVSGVSAINVIWAPRKNC
jgi:hypothetical protein